MKLVHWSLFVSGIFFGGTVDHLLFALTKSPVTPYGIRLGVAGNWWMAVFDLVVTIGFFIPFVSWIVGAYMCYHLSKRFGFDIPFTIGLVFLPFIFFPILAFGDAVYTKPEIKTEN